jgi:hypothetical protein
MTGDQRLAFDVIRSLAEPHRFRVKPDVEGWPIIPGRLGQIEWFDHGTIAVYSDHPAMFRKILEIPGVRRHQAGGKELRILAAPTLLPSLAGLIGARRRKVLTPEQRQKLAAASVRFTSGGQKGGQSAEAV